MKTKEIAERLVELCRNGDFAAAQDELFSDDAVSIEPHSTPAFEKETKGREALREKMAKWNSMVEATHSLNVSDPLVAGNAFACSIEMNVTMKERGNMDIAELCVYEVKDGKIISEQFFM